MGSMQALSLYLRKDIKKLEKVQRRATKLTPEVKDFPYEEKLKEMKLTTIEERKKKEIKSKF